MIFKFLQKMLKKDALLKITKGASSSKKKILRTPTSQTFHELLQIVSFLFLPLPIQSYLNMVHFFTQYNKSLKFIPQTLNVHELATLVICIDLKLLAVASPEVRAAVPDLRVTSS